MPAKQKKSESAQGSQQPCHSDQQAQEVEPRSNAFAAEFAIRKASEQDTGAKDTLKGAIATAVGTTDLGDSILDLFGARENEADLDLLEDIESELADFDGGLQDLKRLCERDFRNLTMHQRASKGVDSVHAASDTLLKKVMGIQEVPELADRDALTKFARGGADSFEKAAGDPDTCFTQLALLAFDIDEQLGSLAGPEARAVLDAANKLDLVGLQSQAGTSEGVDYATWQRHIDDISDLSGPVSDIIGSSAELIPFEHTKAREQMTGLGKAVGSLGDIKGKFDSVVSLAKLVAALSEISDFDPTDRSTENRLMMAEKFSRLCEAAGEMGEHLADGGIATMFKGYATFVKELGKSNFFSDVAHGIDPGLRKRDQAAWDSIPGGNPAR